LADAQLERQYLVFQLMDTEGAVDDDFRPWNQLDLLSGVTEDRKRAENEDCSDQKQHNPSDYRYPFICSESHGGMPLWLYLQEANNGKKTEINVLVTRTTVARTRVEGYRIIFHKLQNVDATN